MRFESYEFDSKTDLRRVSTPKQELWSASEGDYFKGEPWKIVVEAQSSFSAYLVGFLKKTLFLAYCTGLFCERDKEHTVILSYFMYFIKFTLLGWSSITTPDEDVKVLLQIKPARVAGYLAGLLYHWLPDPCITFWGMTWYSVGSLGPQSRAKTCLPAPNSGVSSSWTTPPVEEAFLLSSLWMVGTTTYPTRQGQSQCT